MKPGTRVLPCGEGRRRGEGVVVVSGGVRRGGGSAVGYRRGQNPEREEKKEGRRCVTLASSRSRESESGIELSSTTMTGMWEYIVGLGEGIAGESVTQHTGWRGELWAAKQIRPKHFFLPKQWCSPRLALTSGTAGDRRWWSGGYVPSVGGQGM